MGTPPNPSPNTFPSRGPIPNPNPNPGPTQTVAPRLKSPSFEEISKLFSLPLSDAADSLGVCPSVLKKVCYDNGLVRWPYRNFLAGKSIEEIKKEAVTEKEKQLNELKVVGERNVTSANPALSTSLAPQPQSITTSNVHEYPASRMLTQQPNTNKGTAQGFDEFKYGFPINGLSMTSYRWWGNKNDKENDVDNQQSSNEDAEKEKQSTNSVDGGTDVSAMETTKGEKNGTDVNKQSSLTALRERAAKEGREAMKLGVHRRHSVKIIDPSKKLLLQIFKSSLPCEWGVASPERQRPERTNEVSDGTG